MPAIATTTEVLSEIARWAAGALGAVGAHVFLEDRDAEQLRSVASYGPGGSESAATQLVRRAMALGDVCQSTEGGRFERGYGRMLSGAAAPIGAAGALWVGAPSPRHFDDAELAELSRLARMAVVAVTSEPAEAPALAPGVVSALAALLDLRDGYAAADARQMVRLADGIGQRLGGGAAARSELPPAARPRGLGENGGADAL